jgi:hypothetical protein
MPSPLVSIIMPVRNGERYLQQAMSSILAQSLAEFELIIINDGSTDGTRAILSNYHDPRIIVVDQPQEGLVFSLNFGLAMARGQYIARMDCDDICFPRRIEKQIAFLGKHPEVGILGTACMIIDSSGRQLHLKKWPTNSIALRWASLIDTPFAHPTVVMVRSVLTDNKLLYDQDCHAVEDYDLWVRLLNHTNGNNLCEALLYYRLHEDSQSSRFRMVQQTNHCRVALRAIREYLPQIHLSAEQIRVLRALFVGGRRSVPDLDSKRPEAVEVYLEMFEQFIARHHGHADLWQLWRQETFRILSRAFRPPPMKGWKRTVRRLLELRSQLQ